MPNIILLFYYKWRLQFGGWASQKFQWANVDLQRQRKLCICHGSALWQAGKRASLMTFSLRNHRFQCGKIDLQGEDLALPIFQPDRQRKGRVIWLYFFRIKDSSVGKWTYFEKFGNGHAWRQAEKRGSQGTVSLQERKLHWEIVVGSEVDKRY